jgi:RsiW-degrading membrane proteinase PrsW (M82 family)
MPAAPVPRQPWRWEVTRVPRAYHDSFPPTMRPKLRPAFDVFFWSWLVLTVVGLGFAAVMVVGGMMVTGPGPALLSGAIGILCTVVVWAVLSRLLIYRGTPLLLAGAAVLWGGTAAVLLGGFTSAGHLGDLAYTWGVPELSMSLAGAWPEETAKVLGVWLLLLVGRTWWNRPWHGLVGGMLVGIGFEFFESSLYAVTFAPMHADNDIAGVLETWATRMTAGPLLHMLCAGIAGLGVGVAVYAAGPGRGRRLAWAGGCWAAAFAVHALWNLDTGGAAADISAVDVVQMVVAWGSGAVLLVGSIVRCTRSARSLAARGLYPAVTVYRRVPAW